MNVHIVSLINALILVGLGAWGYFGSASPSATALIPVVVGLILVALNKGIKNHHKVAAHIAVVLTLLIFGGLIKPLTGALDRSDHIAVVRVVIMLLSTLIALIYFVKSFIEARKSKSQG